MNKSSNYSLQLVWFKRDLRIHDHIPLAIAAARGPVLPLYIVEPELWQQPDRSLRQWQFVKDCLVELNETLEDLGQALIFRRGNAIEVLAHLFKTHPFCSLLSHEETGTHWTRQRDDAVAKWCREMGIQWEQTPSNGVVRGLKSRNDWAFERDRRMQAAQIKPPKRLIPLQNICTEIIPQTPDSSLKRRDFAHCTAQRGGRKLGIETLNSFLDQRAEHYNASLSGPGASPSFCSRLSAHICYGTLTIKEIEQSLKARQRELWQREESAVRPLRRNLASYQSRIAWRCHFTQKLEDRPEIETSCLHPAFEGMREPHFDQSHFEAWKNGKTGFPLIDACMRWLHLHGWLTFRMRAMLVSFAGYHLWLDWRPTSRFLAQMFTDYEPGIHYPQFQMQSGVTGINTARMYNPTKQARELDAEGHFIRKNVKELANVPVPWIHAPWEMSVDLENKYSCSVGVDYPLPIVDAGSALRRARSEIYSRRRQPGFRQEADRIYEQLGSRKKQPQRAQKKRKEPPSSNQLKLWSS